MVGKSTMSTVLHCIQDEWQSDNWSDGSQGYFSDRGYDREDDQEDDQGDDQGDEVSFFNKINSDQVYRNDWLPADSFSLFTFR